MPEDTVPGESELSCPVCQSRGSESTVVPPPVAMPRLPPPVVSGYEILNEVGRGGMGIVYRARQHGLNRIVALKMILSGAYAGADELARFRTEAEALARLRHPNIVQIYEIGEIAGRPYLSLEYVEGGSLADQLERAPLPAVAAARLVETLSHAMAAAHQQHVLHRDLKPANILLQWTEDRGQKTEDGGQVAGGSEGPSGSSVLCLLSSALCPKITDFGLAKKLDEAGQTSTGAVMGTPSYMAPEQAAGRVREIGPATDVYALGAILYECLTGRPPFKAATSYATMLQVLEQEPVAPSQLQPGIPRDLETVCLKCLHKDPRRRYAAAEDLAEDLRRYVVGEPIAARPVSRAERVLKWARRRPALATLAALVLLAAVGLLGGGVWFTMQLDEARLQAEGHAQNEERLRAEAKQLQGVAEQRAQDLQTALEKVQEAERRARADAERLAIATGRAADNAWDAGRVDEARAFLDQVPPHLRGWEWYYRQRRFQGSYATLHGHLGAVQAVAFSPDGQRLASGSMDHTVTVWEARTGTAVLTLRGHTEGVNGVAYSPDGQRLASAGHDHTVKVWDARTGAELRTLNGHAVLVEVVVFSPDGQRLASAGGDRTIKIWDSRSGEELLDLPGDLNRNALAFSPDGQRLASASADAVKVWDVHTGAEILRLDGHTDTVSAVAYSPDGRRLASASWDQTVKVWDTRTKAALLTLRGHVERINAVAFSPDGQQLASAGEDRTVRVWDIHTGAEVYTLRGHTDTVHALAYSPDGQRLVSASNDKTLKLWDVRTGTGVLTLHDHLDWVGAVAYSPDGQQLASASKDGTIRVHEACGGANLRTLRGHREWVTTLAYSPDGERLASGGYDRTVRLWETRTGAELLTLRGHTDAIYAVVYSPDGQRLASAGEDRTVRVWDARTGEVVLTLRGHADAVWTVAYSPDGQHLASGSRDQTVKVWDAHTGAEVRTLRGHADRVFGVAYRPDGERLASASEDRTVKVWDARSGAELLTLRGHSDRVYGVAYSPDGQRLASAGADGTVKVWDTRTGAAVLTLRGHGGEVWAVAYSPDGGRLASASWDNTVKVWDARPGNADFTLRNHADPIAAVGYSADGRRLVSQDVRGTVRAWDATTGAPLPAPEEPAALADGPGARHPSRPQLALNYGDRIEVVDVGPPEARELGYREGMARFDVAWHLQCAHEAEHQQAWFAMAFHWGLLIEHEPANLDYWEELEAACANLQDWEPALAVCARLLQTVPTLGPAYFLRARLRARLFQFDAATLDLLAGMAGAAANPVGWPEFARSAQTRGERAADLGLWGLAAEEFAWAAAWERTNPWHRQRLAWVPLAAGKLGGFRTPCRYLYDHYRGVADVEGRYRLVAELGFALEPGPSLLRGLGQPAADLVLEARQAERRAAIVYTACLVPYHGLPADDLVRLAEKSVAAKQTAFNLGVLGAAQYRAGHHTDASATLEKAVKTESEDGSNWMKLFLAMAYQQQGQADKARAWFDKVKLAEDAGWEERLLHSRLSAEAGKLLHKAPEPNR